MAKTPKTTETSANVTIPALTQHSVKLRIVGTTPLFMNRMAEKARQTLFLGGGKKTTAEKANLKHDPYAEFRAAAHRMNDGSAFFGFPVVGLKAAMAEAAIETAGVKKSSIQRLLFLPGEMVPIYGIPKLRLDVVRSADIARTPDIRSRPYFERWGAEVEIRFVAPQLTRVDVATLLSNAGAIIGIGDYRQAKGKGNYGLFRVLDAVSPDPEWDDLTQNAGRAVQEEAFNNPSFANAETAELMAIYDTAAARRAA